jgi:hypothetical protein
MPGERVSRAWLAEFCRLRNKVCYDHDSFKLQLARMKPWKAIQKVSIFDQILGNLNKVYKLEDIDLGATETPKLLKKVVSDYDRC